MKTFAASAACRWMRHLPGSVEGGLPTARRPVHFGAQPLHLLGRGQHIPVGSALSQREHRQMLRRI